MKNIYEAIARGRLDNVVIYLSQGIDINTFDSNKNTLLMYSIKSRVSDISQYLIVNNIDIHVRNIQGETALDMAIKTRQLETAKLLVIKFSVESKYIDSDFNTTIEIVINKLVTTLLYKSQRYSWNSQCCQELRYYICSLDSNFSNYTKEQYNRYISARETRSGDFFGSYLSDDSDSEEESVYKNSTDKKKRSVVAQANEYQRRAQIDCILFKRKTGNNAKGTLKKIDAASKVFDLPARTTIYHTPGLFTTKVQRDLDHLNILLSREESIEKAQAQIETKFYVAQYRGITYLTSKWGKASRSYHRKDDEVGKPQYSSAIYQITEINIYADYPRAKQQILQQQLYMEQKSETLKEVLLTLRELCICTYDGYSYSTIAYLLQNIYTQDYDEFHRLLQQEPFFRSILQILANPFVSTGDIPYHALKYAYGIKPYKGHKDERLRPRWRRTGRAERPYSGVVYVSLHPLTDFDANGPLHIISLNRSAEIKLKDELNIVPERESCFPSMLPKERVIYKHLAKYVSFHGEYKQIYYYKYGITKPIYDQLREKFNRSRPHSQEMTELKQILGEWLCSYYEVKLIDIARQEAENRGGVLIYKGLNDRFELVPPVDSVNRNTKKMTSDIKEPVKNAQQLRARLAFPPAKQIKVISEKVNLKQIFGKFYEYNYEIENLYLSSAEDPSVKLLFFSLLNALYNNRYLALERFVANPLCVSALGILCDEYRLKKASLLHLAVLRNDKKAVELLLSCPGIEIYYSDESINEQFHEVYFYEQISPLALAIIEGHRDIFYHLLMSDLFDIEEEISYVTNKDLIEDMIYRNKDEDNEYYIGQGWSCREAFPITRTKNNSLLHLVARHNRIDMIAPLLQARIIIDSVNSDDLSAFDVALENNFYEVALFLVQAGCNYSSWDSKRLLAKFYAQYGSSLPSSLDIPPAIYNLLMATQIKNELSVLQKELCTAPDKKLPISSAIGSFEFKIEKDSFKTQAMPLLGVGASVAEKSKASSSNLAREEKHQVSDTDTKSYHSTDISLNFFSSSDKKETKEFKINDHYAFFSGTSSSLSSSQVQPSNNTEKKQFGEHLKIMKEARGKEMLYEFNFSAAVAFNFEQWNKELHDKNRSETIIAEKTTKISFLKGDAQMLLDQLQPILAINDNVLPGEQLQNEIPVSQGLQPS